jgi:hypothetical protein
MAVLANGAKQVRNLEFTLGGNPPKQSAKRSLAELKHHVQSRFEHQKALSAKVKPLFERAGAPFRESGKADKEVRRFIEEQRRVFTRPQEKPRKKAVSRRVEPQMVTGSGIWIKVPPYDEPFGTSSGNAGGWGDVNAAQYTVQGFGDGGSASASGGLGVWFLATENNPQQRVAAFVEYEYAWLDVAHFITAHSNGETNIWVWGHTENQWVVQQGGLFPSWSDGAGWLDWHSSPSYPNDDYGSESIQAFFPASANNWYLAWVWSDIWCDDHYPFSSAGGRQRNNVPFMVFGSL